jgi:hypothetical protein
MYLYSSRNITILGCFDVIHEEIMQIGKARLVKTLGRSRMTIQEASKDITERGILFPGPMTSYMEANNQKDEETKIHAPDCTLRRPEHASGTLIMYFLHTHAPPSIAFAP